MNAPTIIIGLMVLAVFSAIIVRGICNRRAGKGGCSCDCGSCGACCQGSRPKPKEPK